MERKQQVYKNDNQLQQKIRPEINELVTKNLVIATAQQLPDKGPLNHHMYTCLNPNKIPTKGY